MLASIASMSQKIDQASAALHKHETSMNERIDVEETKSTEVACNERICALRDLSLFSCMERSSSAPIYCFEPQFVFRSRDHVSIFQMREKGLAALNALSWHRIQTDVAQETTKYIASQRASQDKHRAALALMHRTSLPLTTLTRLRVKALVRAMTRALSSINGIASLRSFPSLLSKLFREVDLFSSPSLVILSQ